MTGSHIQKGLLPAGLSDVLYPKAQVQAKKIEILINFEISKMFHFSHKPLKGPEKYGYHY